jgi:hypothetical protein
MNITTFRLNMYEHLKFLLHISSLRDFKNWGWLVSLPISCPFGTVPKGQDIGSRQIEKLKRVP